MHDSGIKPAITPMLTVSDVNAAVAFYVKAFGATESGRVEADGKVILTSISIQGAAIFLSAESPATLNLSPEKVHATTVRMEFTVPDPDSLFSQAVACGAKIIFPLQDHDYGYRQGRIEDPFGHQWVIGKPL